MLAMGWWTVSLRPKAPAIESSADPSSVAAAPAVIAAVFYSLKNTIHLQQLAEKKNEQKSHHLIQSNMAYSFIHSVIRPQSKSHINPRRHTEAAGD
jgi:hypothetical protein